MLAIASLIPGGALTRAFTLMQRAKLFLAAACLVTAASSQLAAQGFDGVIQFVSYDHDRPDTITQMTKGSKIRIEGMGSRGGGAMILDGNTRTIIMPKEKQYMALPMDMGGREAEREVAKHHGVAEKTGKTETIAGIPCEDWHYKGTDDDGKQEEGEVCMARGAGLMPSRMAGPMMMHVFDAGGQAFNEALSKGDGILKITRNGKVSMLAVKAQATPVPDAMFAPPPEYTKLDMSQMGHMKKP